MTDQRTQAERDEVRRDRVVWTTLIVLGVLAAAGAMALGWQVVEGRLDAAKKLDRAMALLAQTDDTIVAVDEIVRANVSSETASQARAAGSRIDSTRTQLEEAASLSMAGIDRLTDDEQEQAHLVEAAAKARLEMLDTAPAVLSATEKAAAAAALVDQAWAKTLAADRLAKQSVADYNKLKRADVKNASAANDGAQAGFVAARDLFSQAASAFPEADLGVFVTYVDDRIALVAISKKADAAWLSGSVSQANKLIASYNKRDTAVAEAAKQLPESPASAVAEAYKALADAPSSAYYKARQKAAEADNALRTM
jgi:hypothetical protein